MGKRQHKLQNQIYKYNMTTITTTASFAKRFALYYLLTFQTWTLSSSTFISPKSTLKYQKTNTRIPMIFQSSSSSSSSSLDPYNARQLVSLGMQRFRLGDVLGSIEAFNVAEQKDSSVRPYLWQRGLSFYYADLFQLGSDQFRYDVSVNPLDVEEIVWDIACLARMNNEEEGFVQRKMMSLPSGRKGRRRIMATVYSLFRGDGALEADLANGAQSSDSDEFYANFYLGLYSEAVSNEQTKAAHYMRAAAESRYAKGVGSSDYMTSCAKVHCKLRGWEFRS